MLTLIMYFCIAYLLVGAIVTLIIRLINKNAHDEIMLGMPLTLMILMEILFFPMVLKYELERWLYKRKKKRKKR